MKIVCISDTHSMHERVKIPDGDVLVHAGDFTGSSSRAALKDLNAWLGSLPHQHKLLVPGNHDSICQTHPVEARAILTNAAILIDEEVIVDGVKFYGSPWTPAFREWFFMGQSRKDMAGKWRKIPKDVDVLVTHGPPYGILDTAQGEHLGCKDLRKWADKHDPKIHIFGHIHDGYGTEVVGDTLFVNASVCTEGYRPINPAKVVEFEKRKNK